MSKSELFHVTRPTAPALLHQTNKDPLLEQKTISPVIAIARTSSNTKKRALPLLHARNRTQPNIHEHQIQAFRSRSLHQDPTVSASFPRKIRSSFPFLQHSPMQFCFSGRKSKCLQLYSSLKIIHQMSFSDHSLAPDLSIKPIQNPN